MESTETLHVIFQTANVEPSTNRNNSKVFRQQCSSTGTGQKYFSCSCTMSHTHFQLMTTSQSLQTRSPKKLFHTPIETGYGQPINENTHKIDQLNNIMKNYLKIIQGSSNLILCLSYKAIREPSPAHYKIQYQDHFPMTNMDKFQV